MNDKPTPDAARLKLDIIDYAAKEVRQDFYRDVSRAIDRVQPQADAPIPVFTRAEQAETLRRMADQLEKSDERGGPVARSMRAQAAAEAVRPFFKPATAPTLMRRADLAPRDIEREAGAARQKVDGERQEAALRQKAAEADPMRYFRPSSPQPESPTRNRKPKR